MLGHRVAYVGSLNESPHPKVGKCSLRFLTCLQSLSGLNESPHPKVGKFGVYTGEGFVQGLNESPHPKVGKWCPGRSFFRGTALPQ